MGGRSFALVSVRAAATYFGLGKPGTRCNVLFSFVFPLSLGSVSRRVGVVNEQAGSRMVRSGVTSVIRQCARLLFISSQTRAKSLKPTDLDYQFVTRDWSKTWNHVHPPPRTKFPPRLPCRRIHLAPRVPERALVAS